MSNELSANSQVNPYTSLTPDFVLDALAETGLMGDGRLTALSSYENRVYQIHLETEGTPTQTCLLYTSPSPRDRQKSRMPSSA